jgi:hypothetical protein
MFWRCLKQFFKLWWHFYASGESTRGKVRKVLGLLIVIGAIPVAVSNYGLLIYFQADPALSPAFLTRLNLGLLLAVLFAIAWGLLSAGRAYELSGIPVLIVGDNLEWDDMRYRLSLTSKGGSYETSVRLLEIVAADGRQIIPEERLHIDMERTHYKGRGDIPIRKNQTEHVSVATIRDEGRYHKLMFTGATYAEDMLVLDRVYFHLEIAYEPKPIERWFCFHASDGVFPVTNESPPTRQLANL